MTSAIPDLRGRLTLTVPEAGALLGIGRDASYDAVSNGQIEAIRVGRRLVVPTHTLLARLGWSDRLIASALGLPIDDQVDTPQGVVISLRPVPSDGDRRAPPHPPAA